MLRIPRVSLVCIAISLATAVGCSERQQAFPSEAPAAPSMPGDWKLISDLTFPAAQIEPIAEKLGGEIAALRNTVYEVNGKRVQLNTLLAADAANADAIMRSLRGMKPEEFLLRKGLILYEFVGKNEAQPEMFAGRAHIQAGDPGP